MEHIHKLCQIEIPAVDLEQSSLFYSEVLGWLPVPIEIYQYRVLQTPPDCPYGVSLTPSQTPSRGGPTLYFEIAEDNVSWEKVQDCGGQVIKRRHRIMGYGEVSILKDPSGNRLGLFNSAKLNAGL